MQTRLTSLFLALLLCLSLTAAPVRAAGNASVSRSAQRFTVDGKAVSAEIYNIDGSNYFKLRDVAMLLRDTPSRFSVEYDAASGVISLTAGAAYVPDGSELKVGADRSASCAPSAQKLRIDGKTAELAAYNLGGNNFFRLRDLGEALKFYVGYDQETNTAVVDSAYSIRHTDLSGGLPISFYHEIPVFKGGTPALEKINAALEAEERDFIATQTDYVRELSENFPAGRSDFFAEWDARVDTLDDRVVSVSISYSWYMGGVVDYGSDCYTFDAKTGEPVDLAWVLGLPEDEVKELVIAALLEQYPGVEDAGVMETPMDAIRGKNIGDIDFVVNGGTVWVIFDKYEISYGAAGMFEVSLPYPG